MPASKAEQVLEAMKALLEAVPGATVERNSVLPEKIPPGGLIILRDGDPGEPERALGGFGSTYYQHPVEIEVYVEEARRAVEAIERQARERTEAGLALDRLPDLSAEGERDSTRRSSSESSRSGMSLAGLVLSWTADRHHRRPRTLLR